VQFSALRNWWRSCKWWGLGVLGRILEKIMPAEAKAWLSSSLPFYNQPAIPDKAGSPSIGN
jgi:hypothetical protein